jgi:hypothetical protein
VGTTHYCMVVKFIDHFFWTSRHVTIGLFEVAYTTSVALAKSVKKLLKSFGLILYPSVDTYIHLFLSINS